jgi:glycosyltransferase involved in cell wall biosynthesis
MGRGGSEAAAMWALEALKRDYRVALVAGGTIDLPALNSFYGTSIGADECEVVEIPLPGPLATSGWGDALRGACAARGMRRHFDRFDVLINAYNLGNFGRPAIHLLADFSWVEGTRRQHDPVPAGIRSIAHTARSVRRAYLAMNQMIAGRTEDPTFRGAGIVLANSEWSRSKLLEKYGIEARVLYPPVVMSAAAAGPARPGRFVCLGRISPEKRLERIVDILKAVRRRGHEVSLHVIGDTGNTDYGRQIESCARAAGSWIVLEGARTGVEKVRILAGCAFGIHARENEPFGIAVAEMVRAGCITFAPVEGGPAEILDHPALLYRGEDDAVEKICAVMGSERMRSELSAHLRRQAAKFSGENFVRNIRSIVAEFLCRSDTEADGRAAAAGGEIRA